MEDRKAYFKEYRSRPEVREKRKVYYKKYQQLPEVKERRNALSLLYSQRPERKKYIQEYKKKPEYKEWQKEYGKKYSKRPEIKIKMKEFARKYMKHRTQIDKEFAIKMRLKRLLWKALDKYGEGKLWKSSKYGVNYDAIIQHLGKKPEGNYHIDHIKPLSSFDLTKPEQIKQAFAPENLQWLPAKENIIKGNKTEWRRN